MKFGIFDDKLNMVHIAFISNSLCFRSCITICHKRAKYTTYVSIFLCVWYCMLLLSVYTFTPPQCQTNTHAHRTLTEQTAHRTQQTIQQVYSINIKINFVKKKLHLIEISRQNLKKRQIWRKKQTNSTIAILIIGKCSFLFKLLILYERAIHKKKYFGSVR